MSTKEVELNKTKEKEGTDFDQTSDFGIVLFSH
jgi:hypothetical protein